MSGKYRVTFRTQPTILYLGCAICVYDLYLTSLETYREDMATIRSRLQAENIPDSEWPGQVRVSRVGVFC